MPRSRGINIAATRNLLPALWTLGFVFCCQSASPSAPESSASQTAPTTRPDRECIRVATAKDLQVILFAVKDREHGFPVSVVKIYNNAPDDVIVGYEPGSVVVHCGAYQQQGPAVTFVHRREILSPHEPLEIALPPAGWTRTNPAGERELMLPTDLPPGKYELWASFRVEGDAEIQSRHETYELP
jgi:hypothetical protein